MVYLINVLWKCIFSHLGTHVTRFALWPAKLEIYSLALGRDSVGSSAQAIGVGLGGRRSGLDAGLGIWAGRRLGGKAGSSVPWPDPHPFALPLALALCHGFNLDTENPITFQENARGFGQTVVQLEGSR